MIPSLGLMLDSASMGGENLGKFRGVDGCGAI